MLPVSDSGGSVGSTMRRWRGFAVHGVGLLAAGIALVATFGAAAQPERYKDPRAPIDERVADLLARMTLEEKVAQLVSIWLSKTDVLDADLRFDAAKARARFPDGLGQFARPSDARGAVSPRVARGRTPRETVELVNALQRFARDDTRLGIPVLFHEESLHGYAALHATSFPQAIAMASAWDPDLTRRINAVIAREVRARGVHLVLSPVVDVARDPRWGRIEETFGEDPYLAGELGVATVQGLQGDGVMLGTSPLPSDKVFAT